MKERAMIPNRRVLITLVAAAIIAGGCSKKDDEPAATDPAEATQPADEPAAAEPAEPESPTASHPAVVTDSPLAGYGLAGIADKLQGAWVLGGSSLGMTAAWKVDGATVTLWENGTESTQTLEILAPCYLRTKDEAAGTSVYKTFAFDGDTLYAGLGGAGVVTDDGAVVCTGGTIYELAGGACKAWKERFGRWESNEATCSLEDGVFKVDSSELTVQGEALVNQQMKGNGAEKHADFEAARAAAEGA
jgi:hypothetical protein